jgi:glycosyltransferase involved in cell wall biosynthesis
LAPATDHAELETANPAALRGPQPELPTSADLPADSVGWNNRGVRLFENGRADEAADCFKKAYLADPRNLGALENLIELFIRTGRREPAVLVASQWAGSHPRCARAWIAWAKLHLLAGEIASARTALVTALEIEPGNAAVQSALGALAGGADGGSAPRAESPLPFLRPLGPISKAPVPDDPPVLWVGPALHPGGHGLRTKQTVLWLQRAGVRVGLDKCAGKTVDSYLRALDLAELRALKEALEAHVRDGVLIAHLQPAFVTDPDIYRRIRWRYPQQLAYVGLTTFETESLPKHWVGPCHGMDEIWLDSTFNVREFARGGVDERRLWPVGFGLDPAQYDPRRTRPLAVRGRRGFMFLSVFAWQPRKGWPILVEAFARTFTRHDDVCLVIKTGYLGDGGTSADDQITRHLNSKSLSRDQAAPIIVLTDPLGDRDMTSLYRAADAFVLPTRGEGWGIPFMEAMAMGLPTIGTRWSGHLDFMNDANSFLIDIRGLVPVEEEMIRCSPEFLGLRYADPDMEHLMALLRQVRDNRDAAIEKGRRARQDICSNWTHEQYTERIRRRCRMLIGRAEGRRIGSGRARLPPRADTLPVILHGPTLDPCEYAHDFRNLALAMLEQGVDVRLDHQPWNQPEDRVNARDCADVVSIMNPDPPKGPHIAIENPIVPPPNPDKDAFRIVRVFWETDRLPPNMVAQLAGADEIWAASSFNAEALARWGIGRDKIKAVPPLLAVERYGPHVQPLPWADESRFTFLSGFDVSLREGWDLLFQAFFQEFDPSENARMALHIRSSTESRRQELIAHLERWAKTLAGSRWVNENNAWRTSAPPLLCIGEELHADEMARFYRSGDAYVMPSRGGGLDIPAMEAIASGLPVIATAWGGKLDYTDEETALLVRCKPVPVPAAACRENARLAGQMWVEPDLAELRKKMRLAKNEPALAQSKAAAAQRRIREKYSREAVSALVVKRLRDISERVKTAAGSHVVTPAVTARLKKTILWEGCQLYRSSLALVNRELCGRIAGGRDFRLRLLPVEPERHAGVCAPHMARRLQSLMGAKSSDPCDVYVRHGWPPDFARPPRAKKFVMIQHWEYGRIPPAWVEPINRRVDEVWVASRHVFETFVASGVSPEKVWLVPLGVDTALFKPEGPAMNLKTGKKFRFLFIGGTIWRKGIDALLKGYCSAFGRDDDACLVIKEMGASSFYKGQCASETIARLQRHPGAPELLYLTDDLSDQEMARLYRSCHCLVHPYRGEGFGLPVAEAAACGLPAIVSFGGATDDFVPQESGYFVAARRTAVRLEAFGVDGWVLEPEPRSVAEQMRLVFKNEQERRAKAARLCAHVRENFSWERAAEVAEMRLRRLCAT